MYSLFKYYIFQKKVCNYCNHLIKDKYIICDKCKNIMHRTCYLDINGYRGIIGCSKCNQI